MIDPCVVEDSRPGRELGGTVARIVFAVCAVHEVFRHMGDLRGRHQEEKNAIALAVIVLDRPQIRNEITVHGRVGVRPARAILIVSVVQNQLARPAGDEGRRIVFAEKGVAKFVAETNQQRPERHRVGDHRADLALERTVGERTPGPLQRRCCGGHAAQRLSKRDLQVRMRALDRQVP